MGLMQTIDNSSAFVPISDDDSESEKCESPNAMEVLSGSTKFEIMSRPGTSAMSPIVHSDSVCSISPRKSGVRDSLISVRSDLQFDVHVVDENENVDTKLDADEDEPIAIDDDSKSNEMDEEWKQISEFDRNNVENLRQAFDKMAKEDLNSEEVVEQTNEEQKEELDEESEYVDDFDAEIEISEMENIEHELQQKVDDKKEEKQQKDGNGDREQVRIPDLNASMNNFQSKIYSVYSSFDDTLMTTSVASSSDFSHKSPQRKRCEPIIEWL